MMGINDGPEHVYFETASSEQKAGLGSWKTWKLIRLLLRHVAEKAKQMRSKQEEISSVPVLIKKNTANSSGSAVKNGHGYFDSGWDYLEQGRLPEAEFVFKKAAELNPGDDNAFIGLGYVYKKQIRYPEAESAFKKAIKLSPENDAAYAGLGEFYRYQGRYAEAEPMLKKATLLNPGNHLAYAELGRVYKNQERYAESERALKEAITINPKHDPEYIVLSWIYKDQGKLSEAEQILDKAVELNPKNDAAYACLGQVYQEQKRTRDAQRAFQHSLMINPGNELACAGLVTVYGQLDRNDLSEKYLEKLDNFRGNYYYPAAVSNYRKLKKILDERGIKLVCVQYPMRSVEPLKRIFDGDASVIFVDNERIFKDAVKKEGYQVYFRDIFAGDFGHCTDKGNQLLAGNIADVIFRKVFNRQ
jgi:tetratricopeptide (TPR) repeat protein